MNTVYAFSGLGADKRAFEKLDLTGLNIIHLEWITPDRNESLESYSARLADYYTIPKRGAKVIGLSFGGMCVSELAKAYDFEKVILISTAKTKYELPRSYRLSKFLPLYKLIPEKQLTKPNAFLNWLFMAQSKAEKQILCEIIKDTNPLFLKWALHSIIHWQNTIIPKNYLHIHGDKDRIIPIANVDYTIAVKNGGHLMVLNHADELSAYIRRFLFD